MAISESLTVRPAGPVMAELTTTTPTTPAPETVKETPPHTVSAGRCYPTAGHTKDEGMPYRKGMPVVEQVGQRRLQWVGLGRSLGRNRSDESQPLRCPAGAWPVGAGVGGFRGLPPPRHRMSVRWSRLLGRMSGFRGVGSDVPIGRGIDGYAVWQDNRGEASYRSPGVITGIVHDHCHLIWVEAHNSPSRVSSAPFPSARR